MAATKQRAAAQEASEAGTAVTERSKPGENSAVSKRERHEQRKSWFIAEASRQAANRQMMAKCEAYYDSEQWAHDDAQDVRDRGQNPIVYNEIKPTIDWLIGTERRSRVDFFVVAEGAEPDDDEDAQNKTKLLKYLDDVNRAPFERSYAAEDCFKAGIGWLEVGVRGDKSGVPVFIGAESWRNILWDSQANRRDLSDARYMFRVKVVDLDVAEAIFPDKKAELHRCVQDGDAVQAFSEWLGGSGLIGGLDSFGGLHSSDDYMTSKPVDLFNPRRRVLLLECWSREPVRRKATSDGLGDAVEFRMRVSIMTEKDTLVEAWSPFKHDHFSFVPLWCYKNRRTGLPYSVIRPLLGPQEALNHRMSKSLYEASANQYMLETDAIDKEKMDIDEIREELNSPDGMAVLATGALSGKKIQKIDNPGAAQTQLLLAERDINSIRSMSGIDAGARGMDSNVVSGKALLQKNENTSLLTAEIFDNLLLSRQMEGDITLSLAEQYVVMPMTIRVAGDAGKFERTKINQPQADGTYLNDISARRAHFVVGEQAWKQSYAEASFESLMLVLTQLASAAPQVVVNLLDVVFEMHPHLPRKQAILARIRSVNGQKDPDGKITPEQQQQMDEQAAEAKAEYELQMAQLKASVDETIAKGMKLQTAAMLDKITALYEAAQAAQVLTAAAGAAPVADELLKSAGFVDEDAPQGVIDPAVIPPQAAQPMPVEPEGVPSPPPELQQADGALAGIETPGADGVIPQ